MDFDANTPTYNITIAGVDGLLVPQPYSAGHAVTENEAHVLNQVIQENVRNNKRSIVEEMTKNGKSKDEIQAAVTEYCKEYKFGIRHGGGRISDPIEAQAMDIARRKVRAALIRKGTPLKAVTSADITASALKLLAHPEHGAKIRQRAKRDVQERDKDLEDILGAI